MSLEDKIDDLIAALEANTAAHKGNTGSTAAPAAKAAPVAAKPAPTKPTAAAPTKPAAKPAPKKAVEPEPEADEVDYDAVRASILNLGKVKGRAAVADALAEFGVDKGADLDPSQYAEALEAFTAAAL